MTTMTQTAGKAVEILMAEDNRTDVILMKEVLKRCRIPVRLGVAYDGEHALAYLRHQGNYTDAPDPDLVLLDLNLPKISGWEVLMEIKSDFQLNRIPVMIVTGTHNDKDARRAYLLNADSYLVKPLNLIQFPMLVKSIERLFLDQPHWPG